MTLTEQWKKGELEQGWYYIECIDLPQRWIDIDYYRNDCYEDEGFCKGFFDHNDWRGIDKVLAPVPSYEEWQDAENRSLLTTEFSNEIDELNEENQQLKELLKDSSVGLEAMQGVLNWLKDKVAYKQRRMLSEALLSTTNLLTEIDEVLK